MGAGRIARRPIALLMQFSLLLMVFLIDEKHRVR